jgi:hypothetical protein
LEDIMLLRNFALATSLALGAAPSAVYAAPTAVVERASGVTRPSADDSKSYAEREQQDKQAGEFQGGDVVVIGVSGGALIVLLFLLLILV